MALTTLTLSRRRAATYLLPVLVLGVSGVALAAVSTKAQAWFDQPLPGSHVSLGPVDITAHATSPTGVQEVTLAVDGVQIESAAVQPGRLVTAQFQWQPAVEKGYALAVRGRSGDVWGEPATIYVVVGPAAQPSGVPLATPPTGQASACHSGPQFNQDFSSGAGPFATFDYGDVAAQARDGAYHLTFTESGTISTSEAHQQFADACVEADVVDVGPNPSGRFGVFCRLPDEGTYYEFFIDSTGRAGTRVGSFLTGTASQQPVYFDTNAVNIGLGAVNRIRGECIGSNFTMWVNGQLVGSFQESTQASGDVGIFASTAGSDVETGNFDLAFDNFTVTGP
jgi:Bacterial Ig domain